MAIDKPTKPTEFLPNGFGTSESVVKADFSDTKKLNGFSADTDDILQGDNLNYTLDTIGKQLKYLTTVVDYMTTISTGKFPYVNGNNKFDMADIHTFLPTQTGNSGKLLTTDGSNNLSWTSAITQIGDPIFTLNFNLDLTDTDYVWLEGQTLAKASFPELFAVYGYNYDTSLTGSDNFKLPNFLNKSIWGGTTVGYINAGLPNITAEGILTSTAITKKASQYNESFYKGALQLSDTAQVKPDVKDDSQGTNGGTVTFDASRSSNIYGNSSTVQPPAIKVRVYTRAR